MPKSYTVIKGTYTYPADPISLRTIQDAGGLSKIPIKNRAILKFKTVTVRQDCGDMPQPALGIYTSRGLIEEKEIVNEKEIINE